MRKTSFREELRNAVNTFKQSTRALNEGYIFDGEEDMGYDEEEDVDPRNNEEMDKQNLSRYDDRIAQIREVAIEGLQEYAEDVNNPMYQFFKKIFLECDKACQEKNN